MARTKARRRRTVVDSRALAQAIGERLKAARLRAGLTQERLAADRYTKAYVSALENGLAKPSMAALTFFAERLGLPPSHFLTEGLPAWSRLEADIALAAGRWQDAADAYDSLLPTASDHGSRAEVLRGMAEALCRLDRGGEAIAIAAESAEIFRRLGRSADEALATYWLSSAHHQTDNPTEAQALLRSLLEQVRGGLEVGADFPMRVLVALAVGHSHAGEDREALAYLEEARGLAADLDDRKRAAFLYSLARTYRLSGDMEGAMRIGREAIALYRAVEWELGIAITDEELALTYKSLGNLARAKEHAAAARERMARLGDQRELAHLADAEARIALAGDQIGEALELTEEAIRLAEATGNDKAWVDALLTRAKALEAQGDASGAAAAFERAAGMVRDHGSAGRRREVLALWAAFLARNGEHERAYELSTEALSARS
jgi:tetratricopeptide (TPR) repeat protein